MTNKTNGNGKKIDDSTSKMILLPPSNKNQVVYSYHRPTFESILNEYPELTQFFELKQVNPSTDNNSDISKNMNASTTKKSSSNGKFSLNKIFKFQTNKSDQKGLFSFGFGKSKTKNTNSNPSNSSSTSTVRESLQRAALSLTNSLEINDIIEKQLKREYLKIYTKIKNIPHFNLNNNNPADRRSRKRSQSLNSNTLSYSYMIKILTYLKYQESLKICKAQHNHCEKHKKYIQNLLEIVNIVNKEFPNSDLIINGKLLNYSIMNDEKLFEAAANSPMPTNLLTNSPIDKFSNRTKIGSTVEYLREKTDKHEKRRKLLSFQINRLITKENSSRLIVINELVNKLFNIDYNSATIKINYNSNTNSTAKRDSKNYFAKRKSRLSHSRKLSQSATKSYSSSNLTQLSKGALELTETDTNSNLSALNSKNDRKPFPDLNNDKNNVDKLEQNIKNNSDNTQTFSKSSSSSTLLNGSNQKRSSDEELSDAQQKNNDINQINDNDDYSSSAMAHLLAIPGFDDESDSVSTSAASSLNSYTYNLREYEEVFQELNLREAIDPVSIPLKILRSDSTDERTDNPIIDQEIQKEHFAYSDDTILSDSETIQNKIKKLEADYEYSEYSDNDSNLDENDQDLAEFQDADESDILFEETLRYIEDKDGLFIDFELLIEKASECTEFKSELISSTIRKIKKSPKDSGIHILKLCQTFVDIFLQIEKKKEQQLQQQIKMEQDAIKASQKSKMIPPTYVSGFVPYPIQATMHLNPSASTHTNSSNNLETSAIKDNEENPKNVMRFIFIMFSKYIFNELYTSTFHQEFIFVQDFQFSNSILNALDLIPSVSNELKPSLPYLPNEVQNLKLSDLINHPSFHAYMSCVEDVAMLQFESSLVDFCYAAFKILERIQKIASEILYNKKIEEELEKMREGYNSTNINNMSFPNDNYHNKCSSTTDRPLMGSPTSESERGNSNSLPNAIISSFSLDADEESSNKESPNRTLLSSSASNSSVTLQKEVPSIYSSKKSKMQLRADCQLSCDQLLDITTIIVIVAGPFDLRRLIELYSPFACGLRLSSQLEFAFMTLQSVCHHILQSFNPTDQINTQKKANKQKIKQQQEEQPKEEQEQQNEEQKQQQEEQPKEEQEQQNEEQKQQLEEQPKEEQQEEQPKEEQEQQEEQKQQQEEQPKEEQEQQKEKDEQPEQNHENQDDQQDKKTEDLKQKENDQGQIENKINDI